MVRAPVKSSSSMQNNSIALHLLNYTGISTVPVIITRGQPTPPSEDQLMLLQQWRAALQHTAQHKGVTPTTQLQASAEQMGQNPVLQQSIHVSAFNQNDLHGKSDNPKHFRMYALIFFFTLRLTMQFDYLKICFCVDRFRRTWVLLSCNFSPFWSRLCLFTT